MAAVLLLIISIILCVIWHKGSDTNGHTEDKTNEITVSANEENNDITAGAVVSDISTSTDTETETDSVSSSLENNITTDDDIPVTAESKAPAIPSSGVVSEEEKDTPTTSVSATNSNTTATDAPVITTLPSQIPTTENETHEAVSWTYRQATSYDYYKNYNKIATEDAIIITGFTSIPSNGIFEIPEKINGKTVVAIEMTASGAHSFNSVGTNVRKVYLPKYLNKINGNIFSSCNNLTDIYVNSDYLYIEPSALPSKGSRNNKLTFHTTEDSWCLYGAKYFSVYCSPYGANEYYAVWEEIN